jgi:alkylation response protein AidB-like acyl-CoA dehydrogenase
MWVTNGHRAGVYLVMTKTDPSAQPRHKGITAFLVPHDTPGFIKGKKFDKLGYKGVETTELSFEDARVPASAVLGGKEGSGFQHIMSALEVGRINVAARGVGVAQAAFDDAIRYAQKREAFGVPIFQHQAQQLRLAEMITKIRAARLLTFDAARKKDAGERSDLDAGMAKLFATEIAQEVVLDAMRIHGGVACSKAPARTLLPRRPAHDHRRGHERHPKARHRAQYRQRLPRLNKPQRRGGREGCHDTFSAFSVSLG